jgi:5-methylcytosine-specific restriction endonuclease McrA
VLRLTPCGEACEKRLRATRTGLARGVCSPHADPQSVRPTRRRSTSKVTNRSWWQGYLALAGGRCAYCHRHTPLGVEHIVPLIAGGTYARDNLLPMCEPCNMEKSGQTLAEYSAASDVAAPRAAHPLGRIVGGEWVWSAEARLLHSDDEQAAAVPPAERVKQPASGRGARRKARHCARQGLQGLPAAR